jgi:hypothetical protein
MNNPHEPLFLATLLVDSASIKKQYPDFIIDQPATKIFRSVLMKPEHEEYAPVIYEKIKNSYNYIIG